MPSPGLRGFGAAAWRCVRRWLKRAAMGPVPTCDNTPLSQVGDSRSRSSRSSPRRLRDASPGDTRLVLLDQPRVELGRLELVADRARDYARAARAENTLRA